MTEDTLIELRQNIDQIDQELVRLLNKRATFALETRKAKSLQGFDVYDPNRERAVLEKIDKMNDGPIPKGLMEDIYATIISACRQIQFY